ncbi:hypothetical protein DFJ74DRAFT_772777 [Hyaloraphidium curvatum]|nr:hypothetical protein DFJ74DRAFT_772777 [Hyaloraphidium curvatum]
MSGDGARSPVGGPVAVQTAVPLPRLPPMYLPGDGFPGGGPSPEPGLPMLVEHDGRLSLKNVPLPAGLPAAAMPPLAALFPPYAALRHAPLPAPLPGAPAPRERAPSVSTVAASPRTDAHSANTSVAGSPPRGGPVVEPVRGGPVVASPTRATYLPGPVVVLPLQPKPRRPGKRQRDDAFDDGTSVASSQPSAMPSIPAAARKDNRSRKKGRPAAAPARKKPAAAPQAVYVPQHILNLPHADKLAAYQRHVALALNQHKKRPRYEDYFPLSHGEDYHPCVCEGRFVGMEETVSWIACDVCDSWFHGECVQMPPALMELCEKWFCPSCRVHEGRTHLWHKPCANELCARRWHADAEGGSKYCSRECGVAVAERRLGESNERRKRAWRDGVIGEETEEKAGVFRSMVAGLAGAAPDVEVEEPADEVWLGPLERDDLARAREIRWEKAKERANLRRWLARKELFDAFTKRLDAQNESAGAPGVCGFHPALLRLLDGDPSSLDPADLAVFDADASGVPEGACSLARRSCPRHGEWQASHADELDTELEAGVKAVRRLRKEEGDLVARMERRMEVADMFGTLGKLDVDVLVERLIKLGPPNFADGEGIEKAIRSLY